MEFTPIPIPSLGYGMGESSPGLKYFRVLHSKSQRNPNEFVTEEVEINVVKAKTDQDAKRKIQNTYKHHVLRVDEITDPSELESIKQKLYEKKAQEVV